MKRVAVKTVKPLVSDPVWQWLRDPRGTTKKTPARPSLTELGKEFKTDKAGVHRYTERYERHLAHLRDETFTLLEIGIGGYSRKGQGGASLRMWRSFFPRAEVIGLDIEDKSFVRGKRIRTYRGSQVDHKVLQRILDEVRVGELMVVIDDGSHVPEHIRETFAYLFPRLPDGAIYVIEDLQTSYYPAFGGAMDLDDPTTSMAMVKRLLDGLNWEEWIDPGDVPSYTDTHVTGIHAYHNLVFIEKGDNREGTNRVPRWRPSSKDLAVNGASDIETPSTPAPVDAR